MLAPDAGPARVIDWQTRVARPLRLVPFEPKRRQTQLTLADVRDVARLTEVCLRLREVSSTQRRDGLQEPNASVRLNRGLGGMNQLEHLGTPLHFEQRFTRLNDQRRKVQLHPGCLVPKMSRSCIVAFIGTEHG